MSNGRRGRAWYIFLLPNLLTAVRLCAGVYSWSSLIAPISWLVFWLLVAAVVTDLLDGMVARRLQATSRVGALFDPVADKAFNLGIAWVAYKASVLPNWFFALMLALYAATALAYAINLVIRRPSAKNRVPKPHPLGRGAGFVTALTVMSAIVPFAPLQAMSLPFAIISVSSTALHLLFTVRRLALGRQVYLSGTS